MQHDGAIAPGAKKVFIAMIFVSAGLTLSGWFIDRNYLRHKFRVILALDQLMDEIGAVVENYKTVSIQLLKVAGDNADLPYGCSGYRDAIRTGTYVFFAPLLTVVVASTFLLS